MSSLEKLEKLMKSVFGKKTLSKGIFNKVGGPEKGI